MLWVTVEGGNVPSSSRIKHDCDKALCVFGTLFRNGGKMVPGLPNWSGHLNHVIGRNTEGWGGIRVKNMLVEEIGWWLHSDAEDAKAHQTEELIQQLTNEALQVEERFDNKQDSDDNN